MSRRRIPPFKPDPKNVNCLDGWVCPDCGNTRLFRVAVTTIVEVDDDGTGDPGDMEWDKNSWAACGDCSREGKVGTFRKEAR